MAKSLGDLMANKWQEPPEIKAIKSYVKENFNADVTITISKTQIIISAPNSALAGTLQLNKPELESLIGGSRRLSIRSS